MKRKTRNLIIEAIIVTIILTTLTIIIIPKFLAAQSINTPKHFPDPNFRRVIEKFIGVSPNAPFTAEDASKKKGSLYFHDKYVRDITGIEYFPSLNHIDCQANQIEFLDLSKNRDLFVLQCSYNNIKKIDISYALLQDIICIRNQLEEIDISHNKNLLCLNIMQNNLKQLDVSQNHKLEILSCSKNNLTKINLTNNPNLVYLGCDENDLSELNLTKNILLGNLTCSNNQLTKMDLRNNPQIRSLECIQNQITEILLPDKCNLLTAKCANNQLTDISELLKLKFFQYLDIRHNNLDIKQLEGARTMLKNMYENGFTTKGVEYLPQKNIDFADMPKLWQGDFGANADNTTRNH